MQKKSDQKYRFICIPTDFLYAYHTDDRPKTTDKPTWHFEQNELQKLSPYFKWKYVKH